MHHPLRLAETAPGSYSLLLDALTAVDGAIKEVGHEPNGYFWEGVARYLVQTEAPALADRIFYDPEGSMFCAYAESPWSWKTRRNNVRLSHFGQGSRELVPARTTAEPRPTTERSN